MPAPEISAFGDGTHDAGETGLTVDGGGFGAFPGSLWIYENANRTGNADQLTIGTWNDIGLTGVEIPASPNNSNGTLYLFVQREDLAWSQGFSFTLGSVPVDPVLVALSSDGFASTKLRSTSSVNSKFRSSTGVTGRL